MAARSRASSIPLRRLVAACLLEPSDLSYRGGSIHLGPQRAYLMKPNAIGGVLKKQATSRNRTLRRVQFNFGMTPAIADEGGVSFWVPGFLRQSGSAAAGAGIFIGQCSVLLAGFCRRERGVHEAGAGRQHQCKFQWKPQRERSRQRRASSDHRRMAKNPTDAIMKSSFRASVKVARVRAMAAQVILISVTLGFSGDSRTHGADLKFRPSHPPLAKSGPIELQDVDRACREWTNGCRVYERTANGEFNCSNIGIACQPTGGRCSRR